MTVELRGQIVAEARFWLKTPYHHRARVLGAGVDCLMLIVAAYTAAGILPETLEIPDYPPDLMFHRDDSRYLDAVLDYCVEVESPRSGDLVMWKFGRTWSHGGIVTGWPMLIHAYAPYKTVLEMSVMEDSRLATRQARFFRARSLL